MFPTVLTTVMFILPLYFLTLSQLGHLLGGRRVEAKQRCVLALCRWKESELEALGFLLSFPILESSTNYIICEMGVIICPPPRVVGGPKKLVDYESALLNKWAWLINVSC